MCDGRKGGGWGGDVRDTGRGVVWGRSREGLLCQDLPVREMVTSGGNNELGGAGEKGIDRDRTRQEETERSQPGDR